MSIAKKIIGHPEDFIIFNENWAIVKFKRSNPIPEYSLRHVCERYTYPTDTKARLECNCEIPETALVTIRLLKNHDE